MKNTLKYFIFSIFVVGVTFVEGIEYDSTHKFSVIEISQIAATLPSDLFEALGGAENLNQTSKEITLNKPLFLSEVTENNKKVIISFAIDEDDLSEGLKPKEDIDQQAKDLLQKKVISVSIILTPKNRKGRECCVISFVNRSVFFTGAVDAEGVDYVYGGRELLAHSGSDKFKIKMEAASKEILEMIMGGLRKG